MPKLVARKANRGHTSRCEHLGARMPRPKISVRFHGSILLLTLWHNSNGWTIFYSTTMMIFAPHCLHRT